jgi:GNAT superfamily N-acetyltransferase
VSPSRPAAWGIVYRSATEDDLPACGEIWRDSLNDYMGRLRQPPVGGDLAPIGRLHAHLRSTDPERFWVAERDRRPIAFGSAALRGRVWYLSMLFVRPGEQGAGIGRTILERILPANDGLVLATGTDSAQPVSNALYAGLGMVPRMPLLSLVGRPTRGESMPALPSGVSPVPFESMEGGHAGASSSRALADAIEALDLDAAGFIHPDDHRWLLSEGRRGFAYLGPEGAIIGYGYASPVGRVGPVAVRDRELLAPVLGHLLAAIEPRGASAIWLPGTAGEAVTAALRVGLRLEGFPVLLCWNRPFADFERYVPISPGLL